MGWYDDGPRGALDWFSEIVGTLAWWLFSVLVFLAIATLLFLLARFLVAATRAAHIYIAKNSPPEVPAATAPTAPAAPAATTPTATAPTKPLGTRPPRTRTPKAPPPTT